MAEESENKGGGSPADQAENSATGASRDDVAASRQVLGERETRLKELEAAIRDASAKVESQTAQLQSHEKEMAGLREKLVGAAGKYRKLLLASAPEVPEDLVKGDTPEDVEASFAQARQMVERVRRGLEARQQQERVPVGAPPRSAGDLSAMSPQEKIAYGLSRR